MPDERRGGVCRTRGHRYAGLDSQLFGGRPGEATRHFVAGDQLRK
jgi:hypothetical protein